MKKTKIIKITAIILVAIIGVYIPIRHIDKLHLEKVYPIRPFLLGMSKDLCVDAADYPYEITWDKLDEQPRGEKYGFGWFNYINDYTRLQLKRYMKENDLYIVSSKYLLNTAIDYDDCMRILIFEKLPGAREKSNLTTIIILLIFIIFELVLIFMYLKEMRRTAQKIEDNSAIEGCFFTHNQETDQ